MKRLVTKVIIKMCVKSIVIATIIGSIVGIIGYINKWNSSIVYSNAFFVAGCLLIIAGTSSRYAAGQEWDKFQLLNADSLNEMSNNERANFIINESSPIRLVILGVLSGLWLILLSAIAAYLF